MCPESRSVAECETRSTVTPQPVEVERHHGVTVRRSSGFALFAVAAEGIAKKDFVADAGFVDFGACFYDYSCT
jgi:hypothetical protein